MRIINVIEVFNGVIRNVESFGVFEEQLVDDVVQVAEDCFAEKVIEHGGKKEYIEQYIDEGGYYGMDHSVVIVWSYIDEG
jgi:hypothetical protein